MNHCCSQRTLVLLFVIVRLLQQHFYCSRFALNAVVNPLRIPGNFTFQIQKSRSLILLCDRSQTTKYVIFYSWSFQLCSYIAVIWYCKLWIWLWCCLEGSAHVVSAVLQDWSETKNIWCCFLLLSFDLNLIIYACFHIIALLY